MKFPVAIYVCVCLTSQCSVGGFTPSSFPSSFHDMFTPKAICHRQRQHHLPPLAAKGFAKDTPIASHQPSTDEDRSKALKPLLEWSRCAHVSRAKGIDVSPNQKNVGGGVGIRTNRGGEAGSEIISIPRGLVLSSRDAERAMDPTVLSEIREVLSARGLETYQSEFLLMLRFLTEFVLDQNSRWAPWIDSLPRDLDIGIYFDEIEKSFLPQLASKFLDLQERLLDAFRQAFTHIAKSDETLSSLNTDHEEGDDDIIKWAFGIVFSRSWRAPSDSEDARIVPIADCFNHGDVANVLVQEENESSDAATKIILKRDVERDTELLLSYGPGHDPSRFLIIFGFFDDAVTEIFCGVAFSNPSPEMVDLGCADRAKMVYQKDGLIANAVWDSVLYATLAQKPAEQKEFYDAHAKGDSASKLAMHEKYRLEVTAALRNHCDAVLSSEYRVPSDDEMTALDLSKHPRLSTIVRHNRAMRKFFESTKARLDAIISVEVDKRRSNMQ